MTTKIIAHRGDTKNHPENTLASFKSALDNGADAIELDVHMTSDGKLVVHHDYYLDDDRESLIYKKDLVYIQSLKLADNEYIPTLEEVFQSVGNKLQYEVELKGYTDSFLSKVISLVKRYALTKNIEFTSPHSSMLTLLKHREPTFSVGTFVPQPPQWMDKELSQTLIINNALLGNISVLHCPLAIINKQFIKAAHSKGLLVHAADCNTAHMLHAAFGLNVDQLSTDELIMAVQIRSSY